MNIVSEFEAESALHSEGSRARKLLTWASIELLDRAARIAELEEDEASWLKENERLREALCAIKAALELVAGHARSEAFHLGFEGNTFARDFAPFINLMGIHHKDPDYGTPTKPTGHIDTKSKSKKRTKDQP